MHKVLKVALGSLLLLGLIGCSSSRGNDKYGYYTREDGTRIWYKKD